MEEMSTKKIALYAFLSVVLIVALVVVVGYVIHACVLISDNYSKVTDIPKESDDEMSAAKTFAELTSNRFSVQDLGLEIIPDPVKENSDEGAAVQAVALGNEPVSEIKNPDYEDKPYDDRCPGYTKDEIDILALTVMAEAESEPEYGQRLVIDTVLNRADDKRFPDNIRDVVYQKSQYTGVTGSRVNKCYVRDDFRELVIEELANRTNYEVLYFRTKHYHSFGTPLFQVGGHYFSK